MNNNPKALIISASSGIGFALAQRWRKRGMSVAGTYRSASLHVHDLEKAGVKTFHCDVGDNASIQKTCAQLRSTFDQWDYLVLCPGTLEPVGPFAFVDFTQWHKSLEVNFTRQMQFVQELLPSRNTKGSHPPVVLFFAGGGTNKATVNYSAYTISKIALIKMCELLDAEVPDTSFCILGPGWVKTKIHEATLKAGQNAGTTLQKTKDRLASNEFTPMERVLDCCDWLISAERDVVSGRNFSVEFDSWGISGIKQEIIGRSKHV